MNVLISGSRGLIGSALVPYLTARGRTVTRLVRGPAQPGGTEIPWGPTQGKLDPLMLEGHDAVVHLAGENLAAGRWTPKRKAEILASRVKGTRLLAKTLAGLAQPPQVMVCASAIGYYGDRGEEVLTEESPVGKGFLAEVCTAWEAASEPAAEKGIRVVRLRFGVVLSPAGGALAKMLVPFKLGLGGRIGDGRQYMSWIALEDVLGTVLLALTDKSLAGAVNAVAPPAVTNLDFTKTLGRVLTRPTVFPVPAFALRLAFGEMAEETLLASNRVRPAKLLARGFEFRFPELEAALRHMLAR
ncbi:MAG: TIGR01777 family oxidoreductase [Acidobacteriia bacterium]|nr:TIGR01777 family oxidoreductase [Terriglobia bacterium]